MTLVFSNGYFEARDYKGPRLPGFVKDDDTGLYLCADAQIAQQYIHYAPQDTQIEIYRQVAELKTVIERSRKLTSDIIVPAPKGCKYDPYQLAAIEFGITRPRVLYADEMRLGKTIEAIGTVNYILARLKNKAIRGLVLCQGHLVDNWIRELNTWLIEEHGISDVSTKSFPKYSQWVVAHYDVVSKWVDELRWQPWDFLIIDETQKLTNPAANRTRFVYGNIQEGIEPIPAKRVIGLSGTPFNNRPIEFFPTLHYLAPELFPSRIDYGVEFCDGKKNEKTGKWNFKGASNLGRLQNKIRGAIMIRRTFDEVYSQMPPKRRQVIPIPPGADDLEWIKAELDAFDSYETKIEEAKQRVEKAKDLNDTDAFKEAMSALQYTRSIRFKDISRYRHKTAMAKIPFILEHIKDILDDGGKLVVFAHHQDMIENIFRKFPDSCLVYGGKLATRTSLEEQDRFQNDPNVQLFICALTMVEGLHLAASHHEVFAEYPWHATSVKQAENRCRGRESKNSLLIQFPVLEHSLDAKMCHKIVDKLSQQEDALDKEEEWEDLPEAVLQP